MAGEIELISDGDGLVVMGDRSAIDRFLDHAGLLSKAEEFRLGKLSTVLGSAAEVAKTASEVVEQSALYLTLTHVSAKRLKDAGGLTKTKTKGISHAMLGEPGKKSLKWLQVEDGPASLLTIQRCSPASAGSCVNSPSKPRRRNSRRSSSGWTRNLMTSGAPSAMLCCRSCTAQRQRFRKR